MPGSGPRVDPSAYAATRQANIARAAELRAQRRAESNGGDSLDALTQDARPARKPRKEVAPGWTQHTCKKTGKSYYHHAATAKTTWTRPPGCYDERENVHPSQNDVPLQEANGRSRRRDDDVRASWRTPRDVLHGTDWGILEDGQESFDPEAVAAKLPWRVEPSKKR